MTRVFNGERGDGKNVIRRAREWSHVPIIVLSAREREAEKIESLDLGADDYVNKPLWANPSHEREPHYGIACRGRPRCRSSVSGASKSMLCAIALPAPAGSPAACCRWPG